MHLLLFSPWGTCKIEMDKGETFGLNMQVKDFSIISDKSNVAFYSQGGTIDYEANKEKLQAVVDRNVFKPSDFIGREVNSWILSDADNYLGSITFDQVNTTDGRVQIAFTFLGGNANWVKNLPEYLNEMDLRETLIVADTTMFDMIDYAGPYDPDEGDIWWSYKIYNTGMNTNGANISYAEDDFRPDVYFKVINDAIESRVGLNMVSNLFATDWFKRWLMPFVGEDGIKQHAVTLDTPPGTALSGAISTGSWTETFDPIGFHDGGLDRFLLNSNWGASDQIYVEFQLDWDVATGDNARVHIFDNATFNILDSADLIVGENNIVLKGYVNGPATWLYLYIEGSCTLNTNSEIRYITAMPYLVQGLYVVNNTCIHKDIKTIDYISELTLLCNLMWYHDAKNYKLIVDSKWGAELPTGETVDGFYKASTFSRNWDNYLDCKNNKFSDISFGYSQVEWKFLEDSQDLYVLDPDKYGTTTDIKNKGNVQTKKCKIFAPTVNIVVPDSYVDNLNFTFTENAIMPIMGTPTDLEDAEAHARFNFKPRIFYKMGLMDWSLNKTDTLGYKFALAAQQIDITDNANIIDVDTNARIANLTFEDWNGVPGFVSLFYKPDILIWKHGGRKTITLNVNLIEFISIENTLRYKKILGFRDTGIGTYIVESYKLILNKRGLTEVNLIDLGMEKITQ